MTQKIDANNNKCIFSSAAPHKHTKITKACSEVHYVYFTMGMVIVAEYNQRCGIRCGLRSKRKLHFCSLSLSIHKNATLVMSTAVIVPICIHKNLYQFQFFYYSSSYCHIRNKRVGYIGNVKC